MARSVPTRARPVDETASATEPRGRALMQWFEPSESTVTLSPGQYEFGKASDNTLALIGMFSLPVGISRHCHNA
ncbi:hypothetical protein BC938DRAFT_475264 [Jimgerdemannia flammicorona]|uniref:Uncharacterized protein n=1 Tax=Jimgerdemannia flammicorona TaxID=994334 RepID=A0A433PXG1_9FUNG|nr:hypothetical protein BC938DRAFT_475264 [Jimgerdemannia flammicorona]